METSSMQGIRRIPAEIAAPALSGRIPSLDGLRALSILLVLLGHANNSMNAPMVLHYFEHLGNLGVRAFFVISGFLITTLLLKEDDKTGAISLKRFYLRRILRIFPASMTFIAIIAILHMSGKLWLRPGDTLYALTYTINFRYDPAHWFRHLWSLAVEEQFYLLWPCVLALAHRKRSYTIACCVLLVSPAIRAFMWFGLHATDSAMTKHFQAVADTLATGCLLAMIFNRLGTIARYRTMQASSLFLPLAALLIVSGDAIYLLSKAAFFIIGQSAANIGTALCIDWSIRNFNRTPATILNYKPVIFLGTVSYSLYLWQNCFLNTEWSGWPARLPENLFVAFGVAVLSYYFVERPFLSLKHLIEPQLKSS